MLLGKPWRVRVQPMTLATRPHASRLWPLLAHQGWGTGRRTMQQRLHWLDYDPVALAVLVIGIGMIELLAVLM
jgi:hypothetical protein